VQLYSHTDLVSSAIEGMTVTVMSLLQQTTTRHPPGKTCKVFVDEQAVSWYNILLLFFIRKQRLQS